MNTIENTVRIELAGAVRLANDSNWRGIADEMVRQAGGGVPQVTRLSGTIGNLSVNDALTQLSNTAAHTPVVAPEYRVGTTRTVNVDGIDTTGRSRSEADFAGALAGGFAPKQTVYDRGTPVVQLGVDNARASRQQHDALPSVNDAVRALIQRVHDEQRRDRIVRQNTMLMDDTGRLALPNGLTGRMTLQNGTPGGKTERLLIAEPGFGSLVTAMGIGGKEYLSKCSPELRAININHWSRRLKTEEDVRLELERAAWARTARQNSEAPEPRQLKLRTRKNGDAREVFTFVTPKYTSFDVDKVAEAVNLAMPTDAKLEVTYDGFYYNLDVRFHTDVNPAHFVAGEFFKAGIRVRGSDIGDSGINISSSIYQNLCLNLLIVDRQRKGIDNIRHIGSVNALANRLRDALQKAKYSLQYFMEAWNYATEDRITVDNVEVIEGEKPVRLDDLIPGIFNGLRERELVPLRRNDVPKLVEAYHRDTSWSAKQFGLTKATVANAITRYAHEDQSDPWREDELERSAGQLLYSKKPLPYVSVHV